MCNSHSECKAICKAIDYLPLKEHEQQLDICHKCTLQNSAKVDTKVRYKTDLHVRLSYVQKYHDALDDMKMQA